uniref:Uncharacterized protein n=1 Tax=Acrobeloides nanus TaxID=290746 RepID=A0A914C5I7_9BILA
MHVLNVEVFHYKVNQQTRYCLALVNAILVAKMNLSIHEVYQMLNKRYLIICGIFVSLIKYIIKQFGECKSVFDFCYTLA